MQRYTDLTLDMLRQIDWVQVLIDIGIVVATVVVTILIAEALVALSIPAAIVAGLLAIVHLARTAWALLVTILGGTATAVVAAS